MEGDPIPPSTWLPKAVDEVEMHRVVLMVAAAMGAVRRQDVAVGVKVHH